MLLDKTQSCSVQSKWQVKGKLVVGGVGRVGGEGFLGERAQDHIRAAFTTAEWRIPLYTRAGQPSGLTDLKTTVYSTAQLQ